MLRAVLAFKCHWTYLLDYPFFRVFEECGLPSSLQPCQFSDLLSVRPISLVVSTVMEMSSRFAFMRQRNATRLGPLRLWEGRQCFRPSSVIITLLFVQFAVITLDQSVTCPATFPVADFVKFSTDALPHGASA